MPQKVCPQCEAAVPVRRKTCERCERCSHVFGSKRKVECINLCGKTMKCIRESETIEKTVRRKEHKTRMASMR